MRTFPTFGLLNVNESQSAVCSLPTEWHVFLCTTPDPQCATLGLLVLNARDVRELTVDHPQTVCQTVLTFK